MQVANQGYPASGNARARPFGRVNDRDALPAGEGDKARGGRSEPGGAGEIQMARDGGDDRGVWKDVKANIEMTI